MGQIYSNDRQEITATIYLMGAPNSVSPCRRPLRTKYYAGEPWSIVLGPKDKKCSLGGHLVYDKKYQLVKCDAQGATVITWGKEQLMTWDFLEYYCDEAFGIVDNRDKWLKSSVLDVEKLDSYLQAVSR